MQWDRKQRIRNSLYKCSVLAYTNVADAVMPSPMVTAYIRRLKVEILKINLKLIQPSAGLGTCVIFQYFL